MKLTRSIVLLNNYIFDSYEAFWWKRFKFELFLVDLSIFHMCPGISAPVTPDPPVAPPTGSLHQ